MVLAGHLSQHLEARLAPQCAQCLAPVHTVTTNKGFQKRTPKEAESCKFKEEKTKVSSQKDRTERMLNLKVPTLQARKTPRLGRSAPQARDHLHRWVHTHYCVVSPQNSILQGIIQQTSMAIPKTDCSLFFSPLARG